MALLMDITTTSSFLDYFEKIRARSLRVIECVPRDKIDWTHARDRWTFADLIRHLAATERFMFTENALGRPSRYPGHGRALADGYDAVMTYLREKHEESVQLLAGLGDADLDNKCTTPGGTSITVWKWLRAMVEHEIHHRGQIYLMLGMLGVKTPPLYGLTEEQVEERSLGGDMS